MNSNWFYRNPALIRRLSRIWGEGMAGCLFGLDDGRFEGEGNGQEAMIVSLIGNGASAWIIGADRRASGKLLEENLYIPGKTPKKTFDSKFYVRILKQLWHGNGSCIPFTADLAASCAME